MASKRKRNDSIDGACSVEGFQPAKKTLVFRSPPQFRPQPIITKQNFSRPFASSSLTPVDSDDDLPSAPLVAADSSSHNRANWNDSGNGCSTSKLGADGLKEPMDLFLTPPREATGSPWSPQRPLGRPRSNGMLQPLQSLHSPNSQAASLSERAPTPIHQYFPNSDMDMSDSFLPSRTILSPLLNGDLPSPSDEADQMMSDLTFTNDDAQELPSSSPPSSTTRTTEHHAGRRARLHMGYRADCEKCRQYVPGHYTHILWS